MAHDDFETAIERQLQGALDATETATLRRHLDGCAACRDYEIAARNLNERMETMFRQTTSTVDMNRVGERVQAMLRGQRRQLWILPLILVFGAYAPSLSSALGGDHHHLLLILGFDTLIGLAGILVAIRGVRIDLRKAEWQLATQGGLQFYRERLDCQIKQYRWMRWMPLVVLLPAIAALYFGSLAVSFPFVLAVVMSVGLFYLTQFVRLPRALRERAELGQ